jgi:exodeoxyribonuclease-3
VRSGARRTGQAPTELDVYAPERWWTMRSFRPEVREAYRRLVAQGWVDALRALHAGERVYTFWKYLRNAFERDAGLRNRPSSSKSVTRDALDRRSRSRCARSRAGERSSAGVDHTRL